MKAMILAAGLGKRMRPLTNHTPKPLLTAGGKYLIEYHLENVAAAGIKDVVINTHWLAQQIPAALGDGARWGLNIHYSHEPEVLETAGGICQALPLLLDDSDNFLVINGDVYTEICLGDWLSALPELNEQLGAYLSLVKNPEHNPDGDFGFDSQTGLLIAKDIDRPTYTYSGLSVFHKSFFHGLARGRAALGPMLRESTEAGTVKGSLQNEFWLDVGTPERLELLRERVQKR